MLATAAEKSRQLVGEDVSSQSGKFTWINCFDMRAGSVACITKEGAKSYVYNIRAAHIARMRQRSFEIAYTNALAYGNSIENAAKKAKRAGAKAEKLASRQAHRILGPISAAGWDMFEALYYGGTLSEAAMRSLGTLGGTYLGGFQGEANLGRLGYFIGSHLGSWIGGRVGLMIYDISIGLHFLVMEYILDTGPYATNDAMEF